MNCLKCNSIVLMEDDGIMKCFICGCEHIKLNGKLMLYTDYVLTLDVIKTKIMGGLK